MNNAFWGVLMLLTIISIDSTHWGTIYRCLVLPCSWWFSFACVCVGYSWWHGSCKFLGRFICLYQRGFRHCHRNVLRIRNWHYQQVNVSFQVRRSMGVWNGLDFSWESQKDWCILLLTGWMNTLVSVSQEVVITALHNVPFTFMRTVALCLPAWMTGHQIQSTGIF